MPDDVLKPLMEKLDELEKHVLEQLRPPSTSKDPAVAESWLDRLTRYLLGSSTTKVAETTNDGR